MGTINISMLPELIIRAYTNWFDFYFTNSFINNFGIIKILLIWFYICFYYLL